MTKIADAQNGACEECDAQPNEQVLIASTPLEGRESPSMVLIAPWGEVRSGNGTFVVDEDAGQAALKAFRAHGTDLPIDYEHQSLGGAYASPNGQAPAAGWIRELAVVQPVQADGGEPGLFAQVEWTEAARARLSAREYRYLSPVVIVRTSDRRVVAVHSVALTNKPAIVGMKPIVNREPIANRIEPDGGQTVPDAADGACAQAVEDNASSGGDLMSRLRGRLDLDEEADEADEAAVLGAAVERIDALCEELARLKADRKVAEAMQAGVLSGAQREWAMALAMKDPNAFDAWAASAPPVIATGRTDPPGENGEAMRGRRVTVINKARCEYEQQDRTNRAVCSQRAWINQALREHGLGRLTEEEVRAGRIRSQ